jgi:hypothetical protein
VSGKNGQTLVVNLNTDEYDVRIDRLSIFGNPFKVRYESERPTAIANFTNYFYWRIRAEDDFREEVEKLRGKRLGCHCKPGKDCHGDVIRDFLERGDGQLEFKF